MGRYCLRNYTIVLELPNEDLREFDTVEDLAKSIGCDAENLRSAISKIHRGKRRKILWDGCLCTVFLLRK